MKYLVSRQGHAAGPFAIDEIVDKVKAKELDMFDYIFDEAKDDWVLLMEFPAVAAKLKSNKPPRPNVSATPNASSPVTAAATTETPAKTSEGEEWYVLKGENRFGPFTYLDVVKMLQQKVVFPFDLTWNAKLENWRRLIELKEFQTDTIRNLFSKSPQTKEVFASRRFPRKPFGGRVIVHDNLTIWKGEGCEISKGGVSINMSNSLVVPGQHVFVHFRQDGNWPAFNAVCEVVSKKFVNDHSPVQYGLRFLSLSQEVEAEFYKKVA